MFLGVTYTIVLSNVSLTICSRGLVREMYDDYSGIIFFSFPLKDRARSRILQFRQKKKKKKYKCLKFLQSFPHHEVKIL